jgi:hypothetical protein
MLTESVFLVTCPCGHQIESHLAKCTCPHCGRLLVIDWPAEPKPKTEPTELRRAS